MLEIRPAPLWDAMGKAAAGLHPGATTVPFLTVGATDARFFRRLGTGEIELRDWSGLSGLLSLLTLRKCARQHRRHLEREQRSIGVLDVLAHPRPAGHAPAGRLTSGQEGGIEPVDRVGDVPESEKLSYDEFIDHIPQLLDRLGDRLRGRPSPATPDPPEAPPTRS